MGLQAMASNKFSIQETTGCLMFLSAGVQALLGHKSMAEMVRSWSWLCRIAFSHANAMSMLRSEHIAIGRVARV